MRSFTSLATAAAIGLVLQTTLLTTFRFGDAAPDLLLILCVYLGLHQHTVGAAVAAFGLGYLQDSFSGSATGLNAFAMSLVFLLVYLTSSRLWMDNLISRIAVVFFASVVKTLGVMLLLGLFLSLDGVWKTAVHHLVLQAIVAAAAAPPVFALLSGVKRIEQADAE